MVIERWCSLREKGSGSASKWYVESLPRFERGVARQRVSLFCCVYVSRKIGKTENPTNFTHLLVSLSLLF